jgi:hypothetical protein
LPSVTFLTVSFNTISIDTIPAALRRVATAHESAYGCPTTTQRIPRHIQRIDAQGFADRARRELVATGEKVRRRVSSGNELTAQESQIARLAGDGLM